MQKSYKQSLIENTKNYSSYSIVDGKTVFVNPDYNLLNRRNLTGEKVLFCPEFLDEDCFVYFSKYVHDKKNVRETYRKVLDYTVSFSFISMLIYSLACSNRTPESNFLMLGNWIPKTIITDEKDESNQITVDENGDNVYWFKYSTVRFIKDSSNNTYEKNCLNGTVISEYIKIAEVVKTKLYQHIYYDENNVMHSETRKIIQNSFYKPTEKLWKLVEKARNGELTFVTIDRNKLKQLYYDKIRPLARKTDWTGKENEKESYLKINRKDFPQDILKKYRGYRKIGTVKPYISLNCGTMFPDRLYEYSLPISYVEMYIRSLFDDQNGLPFEHISMNIDNFYDIPKPKCNFKENKDFDSSTYFEFDPDLLINILKTETLSKKYENYILYQLYEILAKCQEHNGRYYFNVNYLRKENGRYYGVKNYIQNMPRELRKIVLSKYQSVDMNCGVYSLLLNIAKKLKYRGKTTEIEKMVLNRKAYREGLIDDALGITYTDVKDKLTMISFGCRMNPEKMLLDSEYEMLAGDDEYHKPYYTSLYKDENAERKLSISKWCNKQQVIDLHTEIKKLGKFLIRKYIRLDDGSKKIVNSIGNVIEINKNTRHSFGEKLAFIYQSEESVVLKQIIDEFKIGNRRIKNIKGGIGLLLHDAVYVHKNIINKYNDIADKMSEYVKDNFGYDIKYETE